MLEQQIGFDEATRGVEEKHDARGYMFCAARMHMGTYSLRVHGTILLCIDCEHAGLKQVDTISIVRLRCLRRRLNTNKTDEEIKQADTAVHRCKTRDDTSS